MEQVGIEPTPLDFQSNAITLSATAPLFLPTCQRTIFRVHDWNRTNSMDFADPPVSKTNTYILLFKQKKTKLLGLV